MNNTDIYLCCLGPALRIFDEKYQDIYMCIAKYLISCFHTLRENNIWKVTEKCLENKCLGSSPGPFFLDVVL